MVRAGKVYATATEDMDCLTFGSTIQLRHLTTSEAKCVYILIASMKKKKNLISYIDYRKLPIREIHLEKLLSELGITQTEVMALHIIL